MLQDKGRKEKARPWFVSSVISPSMLLMTLECERVSLRCPSEKKEAGAHATLPFRAPPRQRETMRAVKLCDMPNAATETETPVRPIIMTGLRPIRSDRRPQPRTVRKVVKAKRLSCGAMFNFLRQELASSRKDAR